MKDSKLTNRKTKRGRKAIVTYEVDKDVLEKYGDANIAILYSNLRFWCLKNEADKSEKHFHDGKYWTYNSVDAYARQFPFWKIGKVRGMLEKLTRDGLLVTGNFNKRTYDRTIWYRLTE